MLNNVQHIGLLDAENISGYFFSTGFQKQQAPTSPKQTNKQINIINK